MKKLSRLAVLLLAAVLPSLAYAQGSSQFTFGAVGGAQIVSVTTLPASGSGELVVSFHGDPATGCARRGVCGYAGTIVLRPGDTTMAVLTARDRRRTTYQVSFLPEFGDQATLTLAHVERSSAGELVGLCADAAQPNSLPGSTSIGGLVTLALVQRHSSILSTRCAGPIDGDVASAAPSALVPVKTLLRGHLVLGLSGTRDFAASGFAGTVSSTAAIHVGAPRRQAGNGSTTANVRRIRDVTETLSVVRQSGQFVAHVRGDGDRALCQPLDSCGISGTIAIDPSFVGAQATLTATAPATRPYSDLLAALGLSPRGDPRGIEVYGSVTSPQAGSVTADLTQSGSCIDSVPLEDSTIAVIGLGGASDATFIAQSLRTRCPGPSPSPGPLALAGFGRAVLERPEFTLTLQPQPSFSDDGYTGSMRGSVSVVLRRGRVSQGASVGCIRSRDPLDRSDRRSG
jgi:hypothetical protein